MLKSPVIKNSCGVVVAEHRFSDKEGGATTNILRFLKARSTRMFSGSSSRLDPCFSKTE